MGLLRAATDLSEKPSQDSKESFCVKHMLLVKDLAHHRAAAKSTKFIGD